MKTQHLSLSSVVVWVALLASSCGSRGAEEVQTTYENGQPQTAYLISGRGENRERVGERTYYENGKLRSELAFRDGRPYGDYTFYYDNGQPFATGVFEEKTERGTHWKFYDKAGAPLHAGPTDSVEVLSLSPRSFPNTIAFHHGDSAFLYEFYESLVPRSTGLVVAGKREGRWVYYHPNGLVQAEGFYLSGRENGMHNVYRETGVPIYRGLYINDKRAGVWEFYDADGTLVTTKNYDA